MSIRDACKKIFDKDSQFPTDSISLMERAADVDKANLALALLSSISLSKSVPMSVQALQGECCDVVEDLRDFLK